MKDAGKSRKAKDAGKNRKENRKPSSEAKKSRKSASGISGSPKKGGHGGKFTWIGGQGYSHMEMEIGPVALDANDPNFDDPKDVTAL
ncbi:hypothetical protein HN51_046683 [Arachis hypogaea]|uniref:Programmed cell death protein 4-like n=1 Tax=Arachis hypogaea TaxID=3818 RepID=A0A445ADP9_ARAHY|nr:programmed cell death protein 4-like [Arachis ipaensis]QHO22880.1 uncharacterized protein DS421_12g358900 [Arachis hypogaea]RYR24538.1 hypothetical protein Ahy_B02g058040 [Arachis hypogaea]